MTGEASRAGGTQAEKEEFPSASAGMKITTGKGGQRPVEWQHLSSRDASPIPEA